MLEGLRAQGGDPVHKTKRNVSFRCTGCDEDDAVSGQGWAKITSANTIAGEIEFRNGDDTTVEASR